MSVQIGSLQLQLDNDTITRITNAALDDQSRFNAEDAQIDLWCKNKAQLPKKATPVLVHQVFCRVGWFDQIIWFNRTQERDELWVFTDLCTNVEARLVAVKSVDREDALLAFGQKVSCTISVPKSGSFDESLLGLLSAFFSTSAGKVAGVERITATGYINKAHLRVILNCHVNGGVDELRAFVAREDGHEHLA